MPTVILDPGEAPVEVPRGSLLLSAVRKSGRPIAWSCRGLGVCVACRLKVEGDLDPPGPQEQALLADLDPGYRLACLAKVRGDVRVRADYW